MVTATFRFYEELNDFLARPLRRRAFSCACARGATAKHMIEVLGVPHTEVELILVNGESVGFNHPLSASLPMRIWEASPRCCGSPASTRCTTTTIPTPISKRSRPLSSASS